MVIMVCYASQVARKLKPMPTNLMEDKTLFVLKKCQAEHGLVKWGNRIQVVEMAALPRSYL